MKRNERLRAFGRWLKGVCGCREWETIDEFDHPATLHKIEGTGREIPCRWRDQKCCLTGRVRRQSNFGRGWATEWEGREAECDETET